MTKKSKTDLLYRAQTIGNIEPIEYMIPYPNTQSLIEGQTIKFGEQIIYKDYGITNMDLYKKIKQTANWLTNQRIKPKDNVIIEKLDFPQSELILLGLWQLGARGVILENEGLSIDKRLSAKKLKIEKNFFEEIASYSSDFIPDYKALLSETAVNVIMEKKIILLSHYGLLVNTNSLLKILDIKPGQSFFSDIYPQSSSWVVIKLLLPIYSGCIYSKNDPAITISYNKLGKNKGFLIRNDWENLEDFKSNHIGICTENSAVFCVGRRPLHLTDFKIYDKTIWIKGHSVMNGYIDERKMSFEEDYLVVEK